MKLSIVTFTMILSLGFSAKASLLNLEAGPKFNNGINVSKGGIAAVNGQTFKLSTVGSGLRSKKVLLTNVKVYVAQLLVSNPNRFVHKDHEALKSLEDSETVAMQLSFLRTVDADKVQVSFRDAFDTNNVDINIPAIKQFLDAVSRGGDATSGNSLTFAINKHSDTTETLVYENNTGKQVVIKGERGLANHFFAIWLGTPADEGLAALKTSLIHSQD